MERNENLKISGGTEYRSRIEELYGFTRFRQRNEEHIVLKQWKIQNAPIKLKICGKTKFDILCIVVVYAYREILSFFHKSCPTIALIHVAAF